MDVWRNYENITGRVPAVELGLHKEEVVVYSAPRLANTNVKIVEELGKSPLHVFVAEILKNFPPAVDDVDSGEELPTDQFACTCCCLNELMEMLGQMYAWYFMRMGRSGFYYRTYLANACLKIGVLINQKWSKGAKLKRWIDANLEEDEKPYFIRNYVDPNTLEMVNLSAWW